MNFPDFVQSFGNCFFLAIISAALGYIAFEMLKALIDDLIRNRY